MPRQEYVIRIFVSSPSDLGEERLLLEDLVSELNAAWSRQLGLRLELVRWEKDVLPGTGDEPQAVIEASIGEDYDSFVGILWKRFGTPTADAPSGTAQEFERALKRSRTDDSFRMMVYFNDSPVPPSEIDTDQLAQIREYREGLGERGVLWMSYRNRDEFVQLLRLHLAKLAQDWQARVGRISVSTPAEDTPPAVSAPATENDSLADEDVGLLDLLELVQDDISTLNATADRIGQAIVDFGTQATAGATALETLKQSGEANPSRIKASVNRTAEDVNAFSSRIQAEVPILSTVYDRMLKGLARAAVLQAEFPGSEETLPSLVAASEKLISNLQGAKEGAEGMRQAALNWPRMSTTMNRARRRVVDTLEALTSEFQRAIDVTEAVIRNLRADT